MSRSLRGVQRRLLAVTVLTSAALAVVGQSPATAAVTAVSGSACGYFTNVSLFGGPYGLQGCGDGTASTSTSYSPSVALSGSGSATPITGSDANGAIAQYGPAELFSGQYPNAANDPTQSAPSPPSGPQSVSTQGTVGGSVTSSASISQGTQGTVDPTQPRGIGPGPIIADAVSSTCTSSESASSGSATFTNGILVTSTYVGGANDGAAKTQEPIPANPTPNYTRSGTIDNVGDSFTVVFNEQVVGPDSITVNAVHMYLLGPTAKGELVIAQSHCAVTSTTPNTTPVAGADAYSTNQDTPLTVPAPGLLANDTDVNPLTATNAPVVANSGTYTFPGQPAHGRVTINPNGSFTYTPVACFNGTDSFKYIARNARGANAPATVTLTVAPVASVACHVVADFDGNRTSDISVYRPGSGTWYVRGGSPEVTTYGGQPGDVALPGDYDGDGKADTAIYRPSVGTWYIHRSANNTDSLTTYGVSTDIPVPADFDGDGKADIAVFRPSSAAWYVHQSSNNADVITTYGIGGDIPVVGDYDGDGKADIAVYRPSAGTWFVHKSTGGDTTVNYGGNAGDIPVPGDYDGDRKTDTAIYRPAAGTWYIHNSANNTDTLRTYGVSTDQPQPGDYDGDGKTDIAIFRPSSAAWYVANSASGTDTIVTYGVSTDVPLPLPAAIRRFFF